MKKVEITVKQAQQFNRMLSALKQIGHYSTPAQIRNEYKALDPEEALEMAYENIQGDASRACKNVRMISIPKEL